jgi:hypothetical protein
MYVWSCFSSCHIELNDENGIKMDIIQVRLIILKFNII